MGCPLEVTRKTTRRTNDIASEDANSHVSPDRMEYVVFDTGQIIPCYVVHFNLTSELVQGGVGYSLLLRTQRTFRLI